MLILHSCDNPPCVNPAHLRTGTDAENMRDVAERKRQAGERNGFHKLTQEQVDEVRAAHARGETNASQARRYGVDPSAISLIVNHKNWRD
jgi:DNA invertase Pin-like site-specific DNA recombinase